MRDGVFDGTNRTWHTDYSFDEGEYVVFTGENEVDLGGVVVLVIVLVLVLVPVRDQDGRSVIFQLD